MFVPFISEPSPKRSSLFRRKGGGGGGKGGGSSGGAKGGSGKGSSSSGSSSSSKGTGKSSSISSGGSSKSATSYGSGGGKVATIPAGQPFAGRVSGGGTRNQVYGSSIYGSGYPGIAGRGVAGRGFPFLFWPLAWGGIAGAGAGSYLHTSEYGSPSNTSRPGGVMMTAAFQSKSQNTTFRVVADNTTVVSLISTNMTLLEYLADVLPSPIYSFLLTFMSNVLNLFTAFLRLATTLYSQGPFEWNAQTLLPPIISILAAYLALASLYRTTSWMFRTGMWFVKWSIILAALLATTGWFMENTQGNTIGNYMSIGGSVWKYVADSTQKTPLGSSSSRSRKARPKPWELFERHREWQYQEREVGHDDLPDFIKSIVDGAKAVFERGDWQWVIGGSDQRKSDTTSGSKRSSRSSNSRSR